MSEAAALLDVIGLLYDSVLDDGLWLPALSAVAGFSGGFGAFHIVADPKVGAISRSESIDVDPIVNQQYLEYYATKEIRLPPAMNVDVGVVMSEPALLDMAAYRKSEIFNDLLEPYDIPHCMCSWLQKAPTAYETVVIEAPGGHGLFNEREQGRYRMVVPHLIRAAKIKEKLASMRAMDGARESALWSLPFILVLFDASGKVAGCSAVAEQFLSSGGAISVTKGRMHAVNRDDDRKLQRVISQTLKAGRQEAVPGGSFVARRAGRESVSVHVIALNQGERLSILARPAGLIFISDPEHEQRVPVDFIQRGLNLTRAEASLADVLSTGASLREAADSLGVSINTAKSQLKSVYLKTNCRSHADLVRRLMDLAVASSLKGVSGVVPG